MCLAVPGKIVQLIDHRTAMIDFMGIQKQIALDLIQDPVVGEYVIVHAGFAIQKLHADDARESIKLFEEMARHQQDQE